MTVAPEAPVTGETLRKVRREQRMAGLIRECAGATVRDWQRRAVCVDSDPELFDLDDADSGTPSGLVHAVNLARHEQATGYCCRCPVRLACLADALERGTKGTRGGELFTDEDHLAARRVRRQMWEETQ